jgi:hypothetical protein
LRLKLLNLVPNEYFCNLDAQGVRCDIDSRPELKYGSVEFTVPADFIIRQPVPLSYVFALDVSFQAIQSGLLKCAIQAVKEAIYRLPVYENRHINKIAIITFDKNIHFYNMSVCDGKSSKRYFIVRLIMSNFLVKAIPASNARCPRSAGCLFAP